MKDRLIRLRTMAAVGIFSFGIGLSHDQRAAMQIAYNPPTEYELAGQERSQHIEVDFRNWAHLTDELGCFENYPDPESGSYHLRVFCADYKTAMALPEIYRDFDFEMELFKREGSEVWYGALLVENEGMYSQAQHVFVLSGDGVFKYQRLGFSENLGVEVKAEILRPIERSLREHSEFERLGIVRNQRNITVFYNGVPLIEGQWLSRSGNPVLLGFGLATTAQWQPQNQAHIELLAARVRTQQVLRRVNPVDYMEYV